MKTALHHATVAFLISASVSSAQDIDTARCPAYVALDNLIASTPAEALQDMSQRLDEAPDDDRAAVEEISGLPPDTVQQLVPEDLDGRLLTGALVGAFVSMYHPELLVQYFENMEPDERAKSEGFIRMMIEGASAAYAQSCQ